MVNSRKPDPNKSEPSKRERFLTMVIIPSISIIVATLTTLYVTSMDSAELRAQFEAGLQRQDEQNRIMNQTLTATLENLQKKSNIQVIVDPLSGMYEINSYSNSVATSENNGTVSQTYQGGDQKLDGVVLIKNRTATFSVVIANVGSNIARIDHISATVVPIEQNNTLGIFAQPDLVVKQNLSPSGQPMEFTYSFLVTDKFAPSGQIFFQIYHDSDKRDYPPIYYEYTV